jgi:hypothetical protein
MWSDHFISQFWQSTIKKGAWGQTNEYSIRYDEILYNVLTRRVSDEMMTYTGPDTGIRSTLFLDLVYPISLCRPTKSNSKPRS